MFCTEAGEVVPRGTWCWTHWDMGVLWHFFISFLAWVWSCRVGAVLFWERITEWSWEEQQPLTLGHGLPWPDCIRAGCGWRRAMQAAQLCMWIWLWHIVREPQQDSWGFPLPVFTSPWILAVSEGDEISEIEVRTATALFFLLSSMSLSPSDQLWRRKHYPEYLATSICHEPWFPSLFS